MYIDHSNEFKLIILTIYYLNVVCDYKNFQLMMKKGVYAIDKAPNEKIWN